MKISYYNLRKLFNIPQNITFLRNDGQPSNDATIVQVEDKSLLVVGEIIQYGIIEDDHMLVCWDKREDVASVYYFKVTDETL